MRNTIILGTFIALLGLGSAAQASDQSGLDDDATHVTREVSHSERDDRHHRYERGRRHRDRHNESREHRPSSYESNESRDTYEAREHH